MSWIRASSRPFPQQTAEHLNLLSLHSLGNESMNNLSDISDGPLRLGMTVREALAKGSGLLENSETPFLDAGLLLASAMNMSRDRLIASYPDDVPDDQYSTYMELIKRRITGIPVSYLLNRKEFFGRVFYVDERVLVPRPDTEILVETALETIDEIRKDNPDRPVRFLDICTGTGCIPITIALECSGEIEITAGEISGKAMEVFAINRKTLTAPPIKLVQSDLLAGIDGTFDIITANPPYIKSEETNAMMESGWPEPALALDGGEDGLNFVRKIIVQSREKLNHGGYLLMEAGFDQLEVIKELMDSKNFLDTEIIKDLAGRNRVIKGRYPGLS